MKTTFLKLAAAAILAFGATSATAAIYDFEVSNPDEQAIADGGDVSGIIKIDGVTGGPTTLVAGFGFNNGPNTLAGNGGPTSHFAYLDGPSGLPGGLGVCKNAPGGQCDPSSDDNITSGEALGVGFGADSTLNSLTFRGKKLGQKGGNSHSILANGTFLYAFNPFDVFTQHTTDINGVADFTGIAGFNGILYIAVDAFELYLAAADVDGGGNNNEIPGVPLPAGGMLLLTGLAGLGLTRRFRK